MEGKGLKTIVVIVLILGLLGQTQTVADVYQWLIVGATIQWMRVTFLLQVPWIMSYKQVPRGDYFTSK
ncbi:unnamed protein product [Urochloa humidicola]